MELVSQLPEAVYASRNGGRGTVFSAPLSHRLYPATSAGSRCKVYRKDVGPKCESFLKFATKLGGDLGTARTAAGLPIPVYRVLKCFT